MVFMVFHCLHLLTFSLHSLIQLTLSFSFFNFCLQMRGLFCVPSQKGSQLVHWLQPVNLQSFGHGSSSHCPQGFVKNIVERCSEKLEKVVLVFDDFLTKVTKVH